MASQLLEKFADFVDQRLAFKITFCSTAREDLCWSKRSTKIGATDAVARSRRGVFGRSWLNHRSTIFGQHSPMPDMPEARLTPRQADQARTDFASSRRS
jgi:hypothetical protein